MTQALENRRARWEATYTEKAADDVSWFQSTPQVSLALIRKTAVSKEDPIVDVGGGASTLVDHLLQEGFKDIAVMDVAAAALVQSKERLGERAAGIDWIVADVTQWHPRRRCALWHDRAVLHFLTDPDDQARYAGTLKKAIAPGGWAIIGGFAPGGPTRCSGLEIVQHDAESLGELLGPEFVLRETCSDAHITPAGREQAFRFHLFQRSE